MNVETIMVGVFSILGGGGLVAIVQALTNKGKNKAEANSITFKNAMELENIAVERYVAALKKIDEAEKLLQEVRQELRELKALNRHYERLLRKHKISLAEDEISV